MASISIHDLRSNHAELCVDSESFMQELSEAELSQQGGILGFLTGLVVGFGLAMMEP